MQPRSTEFELLTPRLVLRVVQPQDAEFVYTLYADELVTQYLLRTPTPFTREHAYTWIADAQDGFAQGHTYMLLIADRATTQPVGMLTLRLPARAPTASAEDLAEGNGGIIGYSIAPAVWGKRYASESAERVVRFAFARLGLDWVQASVVHGNTASRRLLERLGFTIAAADIWEEPVHGGPAQRMDCYRLQRDTVYRLWRDAEPETAA